MGLLAVSVIKDKNNSILGFNILDTYKKETKIVGINSIKAVLTSTPGCISNLEINNDCVESNNGKLSRYPTFNRDRYGKLMPKENVKSLIVIGKYGDVGYYVSDCYGKIFRVENNKAVEYATVNGIANGKVRTMPDGSKIISSIEGKYAIIDSPPEKIKETVTTELKEKAASNVDDTKRKPRLISGCMYNYSTMTSPEENKSNKKGLLDTEYWEEYKVPIMSKDYMFDDASAAGIFDKSLELTAEQKLSVASSVLKAIDPFLYAAYLSIEKYGNCKCDTMGVTTSKLIYNISFVLEITLSQLSYALLHEMNHIVMRHPAREFGRRHKLWNIACDLFNNKVIYDEYGCGPDNTKVILAKSEVSNGKVVEIGIEYMPGICFDYGIDTETMTVEQIYDILDKENKIKQSSNQSGKGNNKDTDSEKTNQSGNSGDGASQSRGSQSENSDGSSTELDGDNKKYNKSAGKDNNTINSEEEANSDSSENDSNESDDYITFKGKKLCKQDDVQEDIYATEEDVSKTKEEREQESRSVVRKIVEKYKMMDQYGSESSRSLKKVEELMEEVPKYSNILARYMNEMTRKQKSYKKPNKRISGTDFIYKGKAKADLDGLSDVHFALDTSGSISTEEITKVLNQVLGLMRRFKLTGRVILWDTVVHADEEFKDTKDILRLRDKIVGNGGTDINCYFNYIKSSKCKRKPKLIIVYTDGCFSLTGVEPLAKSLFGPIVWIISGRTEYKLFKPGFGIVAPAISD